MQYARASYTINNIKKSVYAEKARERETKAQLYFEADLANNHLINYDYSDSAPSMTPPVIACSQAYLEKNDVIIDAALDEL